MKHKPVLWMIICCLTIQVSSCLFGLCSDKKTVIKEKIVVKPNTYHEQTSTKLVLKKDKDSLIPDTVEQDKVGVFGDEVDKNKKTTLSDPYEEKKNFIYDGQSDLTEDQKHIVYAAVSPMVKQFCRAQSTSVITRLIVAFVWHRNLPEQRIGTTPDHQPVEICQLSSNDSWLVFWSGRYNISLWNVATNQLQWTVRAHDETITHCILSSDDQYIISTSFDRTVKIWTLCTGTLWYTLAGHTNCINRCSLSADNHFLLSTSDDNTMRMWSITTGECIHIFYGHVCTLGYAQFYANDRRIVSTSDDVRVWDVETKKCIHVLHGHEDFISICNLSGDEEYLLSGSMDSYARVWDLTKGACVQIFAGHNDWVQAGCFVQKDTWIALIDNSDTLYIWRISDAHCMYQLQNYNALFPLQHSYWLTCRNTECIIVSTYTKPYKVHVLSVESGEKICTIQSHEAQICSACVSSDGRYLFSGDENGTMKMVAFSKK